MLISMCEKCRSDVFIEADDGEVIAGVCILCHKVSKVMLMELRRDDTNEQRRPTYLRARKVFRYSNH
jgi:hypothetical protein